MTTEVNEQVAKAKEILERVVKLREEIEAGESFIKSDLATLVLNAGQAHGLIKKDWADLSPWYATRQNLERELRRLLEAALEHADMARDTPIRFSNSGY